MKIFGIVISHDIISNKALNDLHFAMASENYDQLDYETHDKTVIMRRKNVSGTLNYTLKLIFCKIIR